MSVDQRAGVALCFFFVGVLVVGLVGLSLHQNYCANTAEAEVQRIVFWRERENRTQSENPGAESQAEVRYCAYSCRRLFTYVASFIFRLSPKRHTF